MEATEPKQPAPSGAFRTLVVDDEKNIRNTLQVCLEAVGCAVCLAASGDEALSIIARERFDLAFVDLRLGTDSGLDLVPNLLTASPGLAIVIITAFATFDTAVQAGKRGAWEYLPKPFSPAQVRQMVDKAKERRRLTQKVAELEERLAGAAPQVELASAAPTMQAVIETVNRVAATDVSVLLRGETGTGKSVVARALHAGSRRSAGPFVVVNCPTLSEELLASELFGHARGAFTGAVKDQPGRVETAHGGTLFLDEIGEIPPPLQAKLLRFLQDREFERVGESRTRHADVRVLAATNRDIEADVKTGRFREDLLYRLNVVEMTIPPLRERLEDILPMARKFVTFFAHSCGRPQAVLSPAAEELLVRHAWPGNVRELRNAIERALILWPAAVIEPGAFPERMRPAVVTTGASGADIGPPVVGSAVTLEALEREHIVRVIAQSPTLDDAAATLGIDASTLWRKRKKYEE